VPEQIRNRKSPDCTTGSSGIFIQKQVFTKLAKATKPPVGIKTRRVDRIIEKKDKPDII
jgi:hypothetical protein